MQLDTIMHGDCLEVLRTLPDASVDAIVTDPPAGIAFMGKGWDRDKGGRDAWVAWLSEVMTECRRVIKPGGHALVWALPRTSHWTGTAIEDAGWEVRDCVYHVFGSGFPKSLDVGKALDKAAGARRQVVKTIRKTASAANTHPGWERPWAYEDGEPKRTMDITAPATDAAKQWDGWGTALKPAVEVWWLARAPLSEGTVAANVLRWGTGALNIEASRVGDEVRPLIRNAGKADPRGGGFSGKYGSAYAGDTTQGRWPPHLLLSHSIWCTDAACADGCPVRMLGEQSGAKSGAHGGGHRIASGWFGAGGDARAIAKGDTGTAARYFPQFRYVAKASRAERNRGCDGLPVRAVEDRHAYSSLPDLRMSHEQARNPSANHHPTVKPLALMRWLITLITPPGGIVLDPFSGSGTTLLAAQQLGMHWLGIEQEAEYVAIARARLGMREEMPA